MLARIPIFLLSITCLLFLNSAWAGPGAPQITEYDCVLHVTRFNTETGRIEKYETLKGRLADGELGKFEGSLKQFSAGGGFRINGFVIGFNRWMPERVAVPASRFTAAIVDGKIRLGRGKEIKIGDLRKLFVDPNPLS